MTTKEIGDIGEKAAAKFLKKQGFKIKERNIHLSHNEIDIIAEDKDFVIFAEVKTRCVTNINDIDSIYSPASAVTKEKQKRLITAARAFLSTYKKERQPRFDVIEIFLDKQTLKLIKINHITNAFGA